MRKPEPLLSAAHPDPRILALLGVMQSIVLGVVATVAGAVLLGWLIPSFGAILPRSWDLMKANSTLLVLTSCASLVLWQPRRSSRSLVFARLLGLAVLLLAAATLLEFQLGVKWPLDTFIAADASSPFPGRLSSQTALSFLVIGVILTSLRARKGALAPFIDLLAFVLLLLVLTFFSGYLFGALHLYGLSLNTRIAPQTLFCIALLSFVLINRRTEYGVLGILLGSGIGGKTARTAAPFAILLPFLLTGFQGVTARYSGVAPEYTRALSASIMSIFGFCIVLVLARRSNDLENANREMSLRDELTGLYNRRGFYFLAQQAHLLARRSRTPFFVLFVDLDNLKLINDNLGHDIGSERLKQLAQLLQQNFRETDVAGRLGGDEFVVAGRSEIGIPESALDRLEQASRSLALETSGAYALSFSLGCVTADQENTETLDQLIDRADAIMYKAKRAKKHNASPVSLVSA